MTPSRRIRQIWPFLVASLLPVVGVSCKGQPSDGQAGSSSEQPSAASLTIKGSDTMVILAQRWAQSFMDANPAKVLQVSGGGSGTGFAALINGTADLANVSRPITDREAQHLRERHGVDPAAFTVALDALAVYVRSDNPVRVLSVAQIKRIFRGHVTRWNEVGGPDKPIVLYSRENNSGTYMHFKNHVLDGEDFAAATQTLPGTAAVINAVSKDPNGIGYGGIAYAEGVSIVHVGAEGETPLEPTLQNATSGRYPLTRFLHVYSARQPTGVAKQYIDFILSDAGQQIVEGVGYYPLPRQKVVDAK